MFLRHLVSFNNEIDGFQTFGNVLATLLGKYQALKDLDLDRACFTGTARGHSRVSAGRPRQAECQFDGPHEKIAEEADKQKPRHDGHGYSVGNVI